MIDNKRTPYNNIFEDFPGSRRCPFIPGRAVRFRRNPQLLQSRNIMGIYRDDLNLPERYCIFQFDGEELKNIYSGETPYKVETCLEGPDFQDALEGLFTLNYFKDIKDPNPENQDIYGIPS
ncbi:hypothetical protein HNV06_24595 [Oceanispirochaeta sp. M1]|nr:hypothetical protein [Oceanispirochaeta sp. M1]